jgi:hypothetical protein
MTIIGRRFRVWRAVVTAYSWRIRVFYFAIQLLHVPVVVFRGAGAVARSVNGRRVARLTRAAAQLKQRSDALLPVLRSLKQLPETERAMVLGDYGRLQQESKTMVAVLTSFTPYTPPGEGVLRGAVRRARRSHARLVSRLESLRKIGEGINGETFYWELALWVAVPGIHGDELLGDLAEEYLLRCSRHGASAAFEWYREQALSTVRDCLWKRIQRIASLGAFIDLILRWMRH